jgi:hypothetical protein
MIYFVAMPFVPAEHGSGPGQAVECRTKASAIRCAAVMSRHEPNVGAFAFLAPW